MLKRGDDVVCKTTPAGPAGIVLRVGRNGQWADVRWHSPELNPPTWTKRMRIELLSEIQVIWTIK